MCIYLAPPSQARSIFKCTTGLNLKLSFSKTGCMNKAKEPSLLNYLPIAVGKADGFMPFPRALAWREMQSTLSKIWTWFVNSISYNKNHYAKHEIYWFIWTSLLIMAAVLSSLLHISVIFKMSVLNLKINKKVPFKNNEKFSQRQVGFFLSNSVTRNQSFSLLTVLMKICVIIQYNTVIICV